MGREFQPYRLAIGFLIAAPDDGTHKETVIIPAETADEAMKAAASYCATFADQTLSAATLFDASGSLIWSRSDQNSSTGHRG